MWFKCLRLFFYSIFRSKARRKLSSSNASFEAVIDPQQVLASGDSLMLPSAHPLAFGNLEGIQELPETSLSFRESDVTMQTTDVAGAGGDFDVSMSEADRHFKKYLKSFNI